jgi:hypothetical protein
VSPRSAALAAAVALAIAGCGGAPQSASAACAPVEEPQLQGGQHLLGDQPPPVPYSSTPPTSGWHSSGVPPFGLADASDPLTEPEQVSVLEAGGVVVTYRDVDGAELAELEAFARAHPDQVAVTPYEALEPGQVALTAWGTLQRCDSVDAEAIASFVEAHSGASTGHGH